MRIAVRLGAGALSLALTVGCGHDPPPRPAALPSISPPAGRSADLRLDARWKTLELRFRAEDAFSSRIRLVEPELRVFLPDEPPGGDLELPDFPDVLEDLLAARVETFSIHGGQLFVADIPGAEPPGAKIWLNEVELAIENVATRARLTRTLPVLLTARGRVQRTGRLTAFITADPFGTGLNVAGRVSIEGLDLGEVGGLVRAAAGLRVTEGTADVFIAFKVVDGHLRGGVKPVMRNLRFAPADGRITSRFRAGFANFARWLLADRVPSRRAVATVIPIEGDLLAPDVQVWPAVLGVVYNAFVAGLRASFDYLPPEQAEVAPGNVGQAWRVLIRGERPRARPPAPGAADEENAPAEEGGNDDRP